MHLYGLKFLLALVIIIGEVLYVNNYTHSYIPKYYFNEVADFDDIVERGNDESGMDLEKKTSESETRFADEKHVPLSPSFSTLVLEITKSPLRFKSKIHDIKNRESDLFRNQKISEFNDMSVSSDNFGRKPYSQEKLDEYMTNDGSENGYFMVKEKQPGTRMKQKKIGRTGKKKKSKKQKFREANWKQLTDVGVTDQGVTSHSNTRLDPNGYGSSHCKNCKEVRKLLQIPMLERILLKTVEDNDASIMNNNTPLKYIVGKVAPHVATDVFDKPENIRCLNYILKKRRKRHGTYVSLKHKAKSHSHLFRRRVDPSDIPSKDQFQNIINFIVQNKTFDESYTFVPIVFATVNPDVTNKPNAEDHDVNTSNAEGSSTSSSTTNTPCPTVGSQSATSASVESSSKMEKESTILPSLNNLAAENTNSSNDMLFRVPTFGSSTVTPTEVNDLTTNSNILVARSIAQELSDKVPQLKRNFVEILKREQQRHSFNPDYAETLGVEQKNTNNAETLTSEPQMNTNTPSYAETLKIELPTNTNGPNYSEILKREQQMNTNSPNYAEMSKTEQQAYTNGAETFNTEQQVNTNNPNYVETSKINEHRNNGRPKKFISTESIREVSLPESGSTETNNLSGTTVSVTTTINPLCLSTVASNSATSTENIVIASSTSTESKVDASSISTENNVHASSISAENNIIVSSSNTENIVKASSTSTENNVHVSSTCADINVNPSSTSTENNVNAGSISTENNINTSSSSTENNVKASSTSSSQSSIIESSGTVISSTEGQNTLATIIPETNGDLNGPVGMIPGILIYPKKKSKKKRLAEDFSVNENGDDSYLYNRLSGDTEDLNKLVDLSQLRKLKKDVSGDCKNETDELLDELSNLGGANGAAESPLTFDQMDMTPSSETVSSDNNSEGLTTNIEGQTTLNIYNDISNLTLMPNLTLDQIPGLDPKQMANLNTTIGNITLPNATALETINVTLSLSNTSTGIGTTVSCIEFEARYEITAEATNNSMTLPTAEAMTGATLGAMAGASAALSTLATVEPMAGLTTEKTKEAVSEAIVVSSETPVSLSVASIPNILETVLPDKTVRKAKEIPNNDNNRNREVSAKLKRLEADLNLVNEVQGILNGMRSSSHVVNKREVEVGPSRVNFAGQTAGCDETTTLFQLNVKVVADNPLSKEVEGLGKLLKWKAKQDDCRMKRQAGKKGKKKKKKKRSKKKKKRKKHGRHRRFLGLRPQNFL